MHAEREMPWQDIEQNLEFIGEARARGGSERRTARKSKKRSKETRSEEINFARAVRC